MTWTTRPRSELGAVSAIVTGSGPLIVLIHGVGLRAEAWNRQIDALAQRFRVVAVDMPGHGASPLPQMDMTLADYTDTISDVLVDRALVAGHSMGAMIALDLAARYPDRVRGVAALNAVFRRSAEAKQIVRKRAASLDGVSRAAPAGPIERWFGDETSPERDACEAWLGTVDPAGYRAAYRVFAESDGLDESALTSLCCPALFMTGSNEPNSTPEMSQAMAELAPDGRMHVVPDARHMMPMTHADSVNKALAGLCPR